MYDVYSKVTATRVCILTPFFLNTFCFHTEGCPACPSSTEYYGYECPTPICTSAPSQPSPHCLHGQPSPCVRGQPSPCVCHQPATCDCHKPRSFFTRQFNHILPERSNGHREERCIPAYPVQQTVYTYPGQTVITPGAGGAVTTYQLPNQVPNQSKYA